MEQGDEAHPIIE